MKVPVYERQVNTSAQINPEAFSGRTYQSNQQLGETVQGLGQLLDQHWLKMQQKKDTQQVLEVDTQMRKEIDLTLNSNEADADGKPKGFLNRNLKNAEGVTQDFDRRMEEIREKYSGVLAGKDQKVQFAQLYKNAYDSTLDVVVKHEANQRRAARNQALDDNFKQSMTDLLKNPTLNQLTTIGADYTAKLEVFMTQDGFDVESKQIKKQQALGQFATVAIAQALEKNDIQTAQTIRDVFKGALSSFSPEKSLELDEQIKIMDLKNSETILNQISIDASRIQTHETLAKLITQANTVIDTAKKYGIDENMLKLKKEQTTGLIAKNAVATILKVEKNPEKAQKILSTYSSSMDGITAAEIQQQIESATFTTKLDSLWDTKLKGYNLLDGTPDVRKQLTALNGVYQGAELVEAQNYIVKKANIEESLFNSERHAKQQSFFDRVDKIKLSNGSKQQALNILKTFGFNPHDHLANIQYINELFRPPATPEVKTNSGAWVTLNEGILKGLIKRADVDSAYKEGLLSASDWKNLSMELIRSDLGQKKETEIYESKQVSDYLKRQANILYPGTNRKEDRDEFLYYYQQIAKNKTLPEVITMVENGQSKKGGGWFGWGAQESWKSDLQNQEAANKKWATYTNIFGNDVLKAIQYGLNQNGQISANDLAGFEQQIGGLGAKQIQAIKYLYKNKKVINADSVKKIVQGLK